MKSTKRLLILFLVLSAQITSCVFIDLNFDDRDVSRQLEANQDFSVLWGLTNIRMSTSIQKPLMVSLPGKIIVEGSNDGNNSSLFAVDSLNGKESWVSPLDFSQPGYIIAKDTVIYRGTFGAAKVQAYDASNGKLIWQVGLPLAHSTGEIYWSNNRIYVFTTDNMFFVLSDQGKILDSRHETLITYLEIGNVAYIEQNFSLKAVDTVTKKELWQVKIDDRFTHSPIFVDGEIFLRTWTTPGFVYSINQAKGEINWKVSHDILSNLVVSKNKVYFLDFDNYLITLDRYSGKEITKVRILPQFDLEKGVHGYFIALDSTNNVLAIYFGDNSQILGLRILNP